MASRSELLDAEIEHTAHIRPPPFWLAPQQPCLVCGRQPSQAHHLRFAPPRAFGRKVSDAWVVPLCALHHRALHEVGDEQTWWSAQGVEPMTIAEELWRRKI